MNTRVALVLSLLMSSAPAQAEDPLPRELGAVRLSFLSGLPDVLGVSLSITAIPWVELEAGYAPWVARLAFFEPSSTSRFLRGGPRFVLLEDREPGGFGSSLSVSVLAGARWWTEYYSPDWHVTHERNRIALNAVATFQATLWLASHFGLQTQMAGGANIWIGDTPEIDSHDNLDVRLSVGLAF